MAGSLGEVLEAVSGLARTHTRYRQALEEMKRRREELGRRWLRDLRPLVDEILEADNERDQIDLELSLEQFLFTGDEDAVDVPDRILDELHAARRVYLPQLAEGERQLQKLEAALARPHAEPACGSRPPASGVARTSAAR